MKKLIILLIGLAMISGVLAMEPPEVSEQWCEETGGTYEDYQCNCPSGTETWGVWCYIKTPDTACLELNGETGSEVCIGPTKCDWRCYKNGEDITQSAHQYAVKNKPTIFQKYKWVIVIGIIIILYLLWEKGPKRGFFRRK